MLKNIDERLKKLERPKQDISDQVKADAADFMIKIQRLFRSAPREG